MNANYKPSDEHIEANFKISYEVPMFSISIFSFSLLTNQPLWLDIK